LEKKLGFSPTPDSHTFRYVNESFGSSLYALPPSPPLHYVQRYSVELSARKA